MRTLRKTLCLVLALVMLLGLGAFSVAADDDETAEVTASETADAAAEAKYQEAVDVTKAVGIFVGYDDADGERVYDWGETLKRAQAAVILSRLTLSESEYNALSGKTNFTDLAVAGGYNYTDLEPYIAYAESQGYIKGYGDGTFGPDDGLTGYQWSLMLLRVLGYNEYNEGMAADGSDWKVVAAKLARTAGLDTDVTPSDTQIIRAESAQYAFNALQADLVEYEGGSTVSSSNVTFTTGATRKTVTSTANYAKAIDDNNNTDGYYVQLGESLYNGKLALASAENGGMDALGAPADVWTLNGADIGVYEAENSTEYNLVKTYTGKIFSEARLGLNGYTVSSVAVYKNGASSDSISSLTSLKGLTGNGRTVNVYADTNKRITRVTVVDTLLGQVTAATADGLTIKLLNPAINGMTTDLGTSEDYKKDDYVLVTVQTSTGTPASKDDVIQSVAPAVKVTGTVTGKTEEVKDDNTGETTAYATVTVGGKAYEDSANVVTNYESTKLANKNDVTMYTDANGYVLYATLTGGGSTSSTDVTYGGKTVGVSKVYATLEDGALIYKIKGVTATGSEVDWKVKSTASGAVDANGDELKAGVVYTYASSGSTYTLTPVTATSYPSSGTSDLTYHNSESGSAVSTTALAYSGQYITSGTQFITLTQTEKGGAEYSVSFTRAAIAKGSEIYVAVHYDKDEAVKYISAIYVIKSYSGSSSSGGSTTGDAVFVSKAAATGTKTLDGTIYNIYDAYDLDGTKRTDGVLSKDSLSIGFYTITEDEDNGVYTTSLSDAYSKNVSGALTVDKVEANVLTSGSTTYSVGTATVVDLTGTNSYNTVADLSSVASGSGTTYTAYVVYSGSAASTLFLYKADVITSESGANAAAISEAITDTLETTGSATISGAVTAAAVEVAEGQSLVINNGATLSATTLTIEGDASGAGEISATTINVEDSATVKTSTVSATTINVDGGTVNVKTLNATTINTSEGADVDAGTIKATTLLVGCTVDVKVLGATNVYILGDEDESSSKLTVSGNLYSSNGSSGNPTGIYLLGKNAELVINASDTGDAVSASTIGTVYAGSGSAVTANSIEIVSAADAAVATGAKVTITGETYAPTINAINVNSTSDLTIKGAVTLGDATPITNSSGTVTFDGAVTLADNSITLNGQIVLKKDATITAYSDDGAIAIANLKVSGTGAKLISTYSSGTTFTVTKLVIDDGAALAVAGSATTNLANLTMPDDSVLTFGAKSSLTVQNVLTLTSTVDSGSHTGVVIDTTNQATATLTVGSLTQTTATTKAPRGYYLTYLPHGAYYVEGSNVATTLPRGAAIDQIVFVFPAATAANYKLLITEGNGGAFVYSEIKAKGAGTDTYNSTTRTDIFYITATTAGNDGEGSDAGTDTVSTYSAVAYNGSSYWSSDNDGDSTGSYLKAGTSSSTSTTYKWSITKGGTLTKYDDEDGARGTIDAIDQAYVVNAATSDNYTTSVDTVVMSADDSTDVLTGKTFTTPVAWN